MDTEDSKVNFSTEDPQNVVIPESLGPIAWEFFDLLVFRIKKPESLAILLECLKFFKSVQDWNLRFLMNERRFELHVMPLILKWIEGVEKESLNNLELKILEIVVEILDRIDLSTYGIFEGIKAQVSEFSQNLKRITEKSAKNERLNPLISRSSKVSEKYSSVTDDTPFGSDLE